MLVFHTEYKGRGILACAGFLAFHNLPHDAAGKGTPMKRGFFFFAVLSVSLLVLNVAAAYAVKAQVSSEPTEPPVPSVVFPVFESSQNGGSVGKGGSYWVNYSQWEGEKEGRSQLSFGLFTLNRVTGVSSNMWIDQRDPSIFCLSLNTRILDESKPTGQLHFISNISGDGYWSQYEVNENLVRQYVGGDEYIEVMRTDGYYNATITNAVVENMSSGVNAWTESSDDGKGIVRVLRSGQSVYMNASGHFTGPNADEIGKGLVLAGLASYTDVMVPEPASLSLLAFAGLGLLARRRN